MLHQLIYCWGQQQTIIMYYYAHFPIASLGSWGLVHQSLHPRVSTPAQHTLGLHKCGSVFLFQAVPRQAPWTKTQPPDAHSWVPSPGLATISTPSIIVHPGERFPRSSAHRGFLIALCLVPHPGPDNSLHIEMSQLR